MTPLSPSSLKHIQILLVEGDDGDARAVERGFLKSRIANPIKRAIDGVERAARRILNEHGAELSDSFWEYLES